MSEQLRKYINEWNEMENGADSWRRDKELQSIQNEIRSVSEKEMDALTEEEKEEVNKILDVDVLRFL